VGLLIRGPVVLESPRRDDTVVLDKTGTVTSGRMTLVDVVVDGTSREEALRLAGSLEHASEHPVARAIAAAAPALAQVEGFKNRDGLGVEGVVESHAVVVGRPALLAEWSVELPSATRSPARRSTGRLRSSRPGTAAPMRSSSSPTL
jgi:Cu+-exporting ATPase